MHFDFLYGNDLRMLNQAIFNENAVFLTAIFAFQETAVSIFRHAREGFSPFVRDANMLSIVFC